MKFRENFGATLISLNILESVTTIFRFLDSLNFHLIIGINEEQDGKFSSLLRKLK